MTTKYGERAACKHCGQDVEFHGKKNGWIDRGGNRRCCPFVKGGEIIRPKTKHTKGRGDDRRHIHA